MIGLILCFIIFPKKVEAIRKYFSKLQMKILGAKPSIKGEFDKNAKMILLNHQSMLDIIALECLYPGDLAWIAKKEIEELFFFGNLIKKGKMISLDRDNPRDIVRVIKEAKDRLNKGRVLAIFPEGTRGDGKNLLEFKSGVKMIAKKLSLKIQPVLILNSNKILSKSLVVRPDTLYIELLPLIDTSINSWLEDTREAMQERINKAC